MKEWPEWLGSLPHLERLSLDRCIRPREFCVKVAQLHCFTDASSSDYGAVVYARLIDDKGALHCSFIMGKFRVTPLKPVTVSRLELTAAVVGLKMTHQCGQCYILDRFYISTAVHKQHSQTISNICFQKNCYYPGEQ